MGLREPEKKENGRETRGAERGHERCRPEAVSALEGGRFAFAEVLKKGTRKMGK